jgi:hypothetical protein
MLVAQAPGAQVEMFYLAVDINGSRVYIRRPAAVGMTLGVAYIMTELRRLAA